MEKAFYNRYYKMDLDKIALEFYGRKYNQLSSEEKFDVRSARKQTQDLRRNLTG